MLLLFNAHCGEPSFYLEARASLDPFPRLYRAVTVRVGRVVAVAFHLGAGIFPEQFLDKPRHCRFLRRCARVLGLAVLIHAANIGNAYAVRVEAGAVRPDN